jgi:hypothetical protein
VATEKRAPADWEAIEGAYRAGVLSLREIVATHGSSPAGILKRAKRDGWTRDLAAKIQAKAEALVNKQAVNTKVNSEQTVSEAEIVNANANAIATVRLAHRDDIRTGRNLVRHLLAEVAGVTERQDLIEELEQALGPRDDEGVRERKIREAIERVTSMPGRVAAVAKLAEALKNLVTLERQAWGLDEQEKQPGPLDGLAPQEAQALVEAIDVIRRARTREPA